MHECEQPPLSLSLAIYLSTTRLSLSRLSSSVRACGCLSAPAASLCVEASASAPICMVSVLLEVDLHGQAPAGGLAPFLFLFFFFSLYARVATQNHGHVSTCICLCLSTLARLFRWRAFSPNRHWTYTHARTYLYPPIHVYEGRL